MNQFIKLPDGTIINVALVRRVFKMIGGEIFIDVGVSGDDIVGTVLSPIYEDFDGKIYAWFAERAVEIGKEEV